MQGEEERGAVEEMLIESGRKERGAGRRESMKECSREWEERGTREGVESEKEKR